MNLLRQVDQSIREARTWKRRTYLRSLRTWVALCLSTHPTKTQEAQLDATVRGLLRADSGDVAPLQAYYQDRRVGLVDPLRAKILARLSIFSGARP